MGSDLSVAQVLAILAPASRLARDPWPTLLGLAIILILIVAYGFNVWVANRLSRGEATFKRAVGLVFPPYTFILGWRRAKGIGLQKVMWTWTGLWAAPFVLAAVLIPVLYDAKRRAAASADAATTGPSVAVLPFVYVAGPAGQGHLCDRLTDELIDNLSRLPNLIVVPRASTAGYQGRFVDPQAAGRQLNANAVVEGGVILHEDRLRIDVRLINVEDKGTLWANSYESQVTEMLAVEQEIASTIAEKLAGRR